MTTDRETAVRDKMQKVPTWVGLLGPVAFAVLVTGAVIQLYARGWLPVAGPFVLLGWAPLLVWLRVVVIRGKVLRRRRALTELLGNLSRLVAEERNRPSDERASAATNHSLTEAGSHVRSGLDLLAANRADAVTVVGRLGIVSSRWRPDAPITLAVNAAVVAAQRLTLAWGEAHDVRSARDPGGPSAPT